MDLFVVIGTTILMMKSHEGRYTRSIPPFNTPRTLLVIPFVTPHNPMNFSNPSSNILQHPFFHDIMIGYSMHVV